MSELDHAVQGHGTALMEPSPYAIPSRKLTMWLFIISDAVTFGAILFGYGYLRTASSDWPTPFKFYPSVFNVMIMTFVLITSSLTMLGAVDYRESRATRVKLARFLWATMLLGVVFAGLHIREWIGLIDDGVRSVSKSLGLPAFRSDLFQHYRTAPAARHQRRDCHRCNCPRLPARQSNGRARRNYRAVLAFCGSGLDVCRAAGLSVEPGAMSGLGDIR